MAELPKGFGLEDIMNGQFPGDCTLGELKLYIETSGMLNDLSAKLQPGRAIRVRFMWDNTSNECAPTMTLDEFRKAVHLGLAIITIDDQGGGIRVREDA